MSGYDRTERLNAFGLAIAAKRNEAVAARKESGIEEIWMACEEAYLGIDDLNRDQFAKAKWAKPTTMEGPVTTRSSGNDGVRSSAYVRLTSRYVDAGVAKICEIALPADDKPFSFEPTPIPELVNGLVKPPVPQMAMPPQGVPAGPPEAPPQGMSPRQPGPQAGMPPGMAPPAPPVDIAAQTLDQATDAAGKAEKRISDWMVEAKHAREMRKVMHDSGRIGTGVLKAPFPAVRRSQAMSKTPAGVALKIVESVVPSEKWVDPWNLFPAPACGEDIHSGDYILERDYLSPKTLKGLKGQEGYLNDQIDKVLEEGPGKCNTDDISPHQKKNKHRFEVWYYYGSLTSEDMAIGNPGAAKTLKADQQEVYGILTLVNDTVIRVVFNPMESGRFPYQAMPWARRAGSWAGVGIAEQISMPQRMCNAATRAMINNAGKSAGAQIIVDKGAIIPADGNWTMTPDKIWWKAPDSVVDDVRKAFMSITFPNMQPQMMAIVEYAFRLAEEASSIPLITQGQSGPTTPQTFGAAQLQDTNANTLLRSIGYALDDYITEPVIQGYYEWLLLDPEVPDDEKGDFRINAHGTIALVERAIQDQTLQSMMSMAVNPAFGLDPEKWAEEYLKSKRIDPRKVSLSDVDKAKRAQQQAPEDPRIASAKIMAQGRVEAEKVRAQGYVEAEKIEAQEINDRIAADAHLEMNRLAFEQQENELDRQNKLAIAVIDERMQSTDLTSTERQTLDKIKAQLASTAMKLNVTKDLAVASHQIDIHKHRTPAPMAPIIEPIGRAAPGQSFAQ